MRTTSEMETFKHHNLKTTHMNERIARLIGHTFGDGYIHKEKFYFIYTNSNQKLLEFVSEIIEKEFGNLKVIKRKSGKNVPQLQFPAKIGRKISELGGIVGSKVHQSIRIPNWIKNGSEKIKTSFLAAIFDDEGYFRDTKGCKQIVIKFSKAYELENNLNEFLEDIREMLLQLDIKVSVIKNDQIKQNKKGKIIISKRIWVTGRNNFLKFREKIPLIHPEKIEKLLRLCS